MEKDRDNLITKIENAYNKLKWYEKLCTWDIGKKRFLKIKNSFLENLRAEGVEEKEFKSLEEVFELIKDCDNFIYKGEELLLYVVICWMAFTDCHFIFNFLNKGNFGVSPFIILMFNIVSIYPITLILRNRKDKLKTKNIHYFFLYENLNAELKESQKENGK